MPKCSWYSNEKWTCCTALASCKNTVKIARKDLQNQYVLFCCRCLQLPKCFSAQEPGKNWKKRRKRLIRLSKRPKRMTRARPKSPKMAKRPGLKALKPLKRRRSQLDPKRTKHHQARNRNCQREHNSCSCWAALKTSVWNLKVLHKTLQILNSHRLLPLMFRPCFFTFGVSQCSKHCRSLQASSPAPNSQRLGLAEHSQISIVASFAEGSFLLNCQCPSETCKTQGMPTNKAGCRYTTHLHGNKRSDVLYRSNFGTILADWVECAFLYSESGAEGVGTNALYSVISLSNAWKVDGPGTSVMLCNLRLRASIKLPMSCSFWCSSYLVFFFVTSCYNILLCLAMSCRHVPPLSTLQSPRPRILWLSDSRVTDVANGFPRNTRMVPSEGAM